MFKLSIERLTEDELEYEIQIRGVSESGTVDELRKRVRSLILLEKTASREHRFTIEKPGDELAECDRKVIELRGLISSYSGAGKSDLKIETKLPHLTARIDRIPDSLETKETFLRELHLDQTKLRLEEFKPPKEGGLCLEPKLDYSTKRNFRKDTSFLNEAEINYRNNIPGTSSIKSKMNYCIKNSKVSPTEIDGIKRSIKDHQRQVNALDEGPQITNAEEIQTHSPSEHPVAHEEENMHEKSFPAQCSREYEQVLREYELLLKDSTTTKQRLNKLRLDHKLKAEITKYNEFLEGLLDKHRLSLFELNTLIYVIARKITETIIKRSATTSTNRKSNNGKEWKGRLKAKIQNLKKVLSRISELMDSKKSATCRCERQNH
ncbi:unnamed protein product [Acanthoscelides obtectus]|uniref:Uncharacterized protein n=1 Tax=Acanthoscelides obtectus TaxID=200917 RepID=A0A9P0MK59_ACAOB|nr:unnamed protein product [Acanthoscelides obtectus]CAK1646638.1 hypothetical protein AOBTE_LOCUS14774 [Acanthoscelides obtectus]